MRVDDDGTPFKVTALVAGKADAYLFDGDLERSAGLDPKPGVGAQVC